jgi:chromosome segregation ATPase
VYNREERMSILENTLHDLRRVKSDLEDELAYVEEDMERAQSEIDALLAYVEGA